LQQNRLLKRHRVANWRLRLLEMLRQQFVERGIGERLGREALENYATKIVEHHEDPYSLVPRLMEQLLGGSSK